MENKNFTYKRFLENACSYALQRMKKNDDKHGYENFPLGNCTYGINKNLIPILNRLEHEQPVDIGELTLLRERFADIINYAAMGITTIDNKLLLSMIKRNSEEGIKEVDG